MEEKGDRMKEELNTKGNKKIIEVQEGRDREREKGKSNITKGVNTRKTGKEGED